MPQKKAFILLEVLLGILLVSLCIVPLMRAPILSYKNELIHLEEIERERFATLSFSEVKEKLLKNDIPWESLPDPETTTPPFPLSPIWIHLPNCEPKKLKREFTLSCTKTGMKEGLKGEIYKKIKVELYFTPQLKGHEKKKYKYKTIVQKLPPRRA